MNLAELLKQLGPEDEVMALRPVYVVRSRGISAELQYIDDDSLQSIPPRGSYKITNIYVVDTPTGKKTVVQYESAPV